MVSSKLALVLMLTAGGVMGRSSSNIRRLDRLSRRDGGQPGGFHAGVVDPLSHPTAPGGGSGGGSGGGFGNGGMDPLTHPASTGSAPGTMATSKGGQMHWATDASGMTGAELAKVVPHDFFIGSSVDNGDLKDPLVAPLTKYFPYVTPANSLKMQFIYESENSWHEVQTGVEKAVGKDTIKWKWHTLIWGAEQNKQMMQQSFSKEAMMKTITDFVSTKMCPKIIKEANFWGIDVLNEVFADDGKGFKKNGYFEVIGEEGYKQVLKLVKKECPNHKLIVNDYGMESKNPKSDFAFKTIKQWLAEGVPVDVVGLQFHIGLDNKYEDMLASIKRWTSESIPVVLSEIDIPVNLPPSQQDLEKQAQQYGTMMQAALEGGAFGATFWGVMDSHTWFGTQQEEGMGHRKTGAPLLFDAQGKAKPAVAALVDVFKKWGNKPVGIQGGRLSDLGKGGQGSSSSEGTGSGAGSGGYGTGADAGAGAGSGGYGTGTGADAGAGAGSGGYGTGTGADAGAGAGSGGYGTGTGADAGAGAGSGGYGTGTGADAGAGAGSGGYGTGTGADAGAGAGSGGYGTGTGADAGAGAGSGGDGTGSGSTDPTHQAYGSSSSDVDEGPMDTGLAGGKPGNPGGDPGHENYGTPKHRRSMALLRRRL
ncbi:related to endo-1,4-beta-xylanase b [Ustilago sp. UG-2017a]|nr:related to endo-1,4-beta-xylanase b [Ustilago sp. UG-2017a]